MNNARRYLLKVNRNLLKTNKDEQQGMPVNSNNNNIAFFPKQVGVG